MSQIQEKLDAILNARSARCRIVDKEIAEWQERCEKITAVIADVYAAEQKNPEIAGCSKRLRDAFENIRSVIAAYDSARSRFARNTLCIGIGGAARMGKSTFLQSVTGLEDTQIPTSDKYFTTAVRSQIENCLNENVAVADFHSESSFLRTVVEPMCRALRISCPMTLDEFRRREFRLADGERSTQESEDILQRLRDAQKEIRTYERLLTGERGKRIPLAELRPYVAYPEGGRVKAGPFLAISDLVIKSKFPSTDVAQLKLVDLPGLGEAGRDLAEVQTTGMKDVCDITLLMKRPTDANIEWTLTDSNALDAMGRAVSLLDDQTKYTAILANVGGEDAGRAAECVDAIKAKLGRPFKIIECNARDRDSVAGKTMPEILDFLATNLPEIDNAIMDRLSQSAALALKAISDEVAEVRSITCSRAPNQGSDDDFANELINKVSDILTERLCDAEKRTDGNDGDWDAEVKRIQDNVKKWIDEGCGFGSADLLQDEIRKEIIRRNGQPSTVINECRNKFRAEWEAMDLHLGNRISQLLGGTLDSLRGALHGFIPERENDSLEAVRKQIVAFAKRIDERPEFPGDAEALRDLSDPLRRIAEFDLQFRFHLEPMLHATTHLLKSNELPLVQGQEDAQMFREKLCAKLKEAADAYASGMLKSGMGSSASLERKKRLLDKAIPDKVVRDDIITQLEQSAGAAQSFCPNRIFHAVMDTFADAFIRQKNSEKAFRILAHRWRNELSPSPDEKTRLLNAAAGSLAALSL